ncbi:MAG TPA: hypothetical protein VKZ81_32530 [Pseudonocardia sp.]|jgi:hypothetical protein|uniref:hypothetical protein n=1 Tax=Pseudonocardia sp. TaxID=60912 RepID=UPI002B4B1A4C|nr:hypothetical protein [Pseudonocardia sp.]HLU60212.1 hypothetical protein [Pseudonocardia sp.]
MDTRCTDRGAASDPVFRATAVACIVAGVAGVAGALWQFVPLRVPDGAIYWLFTLLGAALLLWPPLTHLVGGVLMLRRGSAGAAVVTAFVSGWATLSLLALNVGVLLHPYLLAQAGATAVLTGLIVWAVARRRRGRPTRSGPGPETLPAPGGRP